MGDRLVAAAENLQLTGQMNGTEKLKKQSAAEGETTRQPTCCNGRRGLPLFVVNLCAMLLFWMIGNVYTGGVIRTIERKFSLRSTQTGFLSSCNDIIQTSLVVFVGYFGRKANKPKILSVTVAFSAIAFLLMASPHWLFDSSSAFPSTTSIDIYSNSSVQKSTRSTCWAANFDKNGQNLTECGYTASPDSVQVIPRNDRVHSAYYVFVFAQLLSGVGSSGLHSLSLAYIDENAPKSKSSLYVGFVTSMYAFGPIGGFMMAAVTLRLPENLMSPTIEDPKDPAFIGCWWLGYLICAVGILITAIPMWFFPKSFNKNSQNGHTKHLVPVTLESEQLTKRSGSQTIRQVWKQVKRFPKDLMHLLRNKPYVVMLGCVVSGAYIIVGVFVNMVRYIEIHFHERAFVASIITGFVSAFAGAIGGLAGGLLMSRMRLGPAGAVRIMIFSTAVFAAGLLIILFLSCPQVEVAGNIDPVHKTLNVLNDCNRQCACSSDRKSFAPVCGSDGLTHFSGCFAGCASKVNETYHNCSCIKSNSLDDGNLLLTAKQGMCVPECNMLIPYAITMFVISLIGSVARVPGTIVNFRIVDDDERSFALAMNSFAMNLVGFIPAPILFGRLIDSSCRMWERTAAISSTFVPCGGGPMTAYSGGTGSCLLFDTAKFRRRTYGFSFGFELIDLVCVVILYRLIRNRKFKVDENDDDKNNTNHRVDDENSENNTRKNSIAKNGLPQQELDFVEMTTDVRESVV